MLTSPLKRATHEDSSVLNSILYKFFAVVSFAGWAGKDRSLLPLSLRGNS